MNRAIDSSTPPATRSGLIEVSTVTQREFDRVAFWADMVCQHFVPAECSSVAVPAQFVGAIALRSLGPVNVAQIVSSAQEVTRTSQPIAQARGEYFLVNIQLSGSSSVRQAGRMTMLGLGDLAVFSSADPFQLSFDCDFSQMVVTVPAEELRHLVPEVDRLTATQLDGQGSAALLLKQMVHHCFDASSDSFSPRSARHVASSLIEILAGTLSECSTIAGAKRSQMARYHLSCIKEHARRNLHDAELSVVSLSAALRLSPAHVHRLFADEAQTFSAWLWSCRLLACKSDFDSGVYDHLLITEIAFKNGFSNSAHFSRSFSAKFDVSPREYRALRAAKFKLSKPYS